VRQVVESFGTAREFAHRASLPLQMGRGRRGTAGGSPDRRSGGNSTIHQWRTPAAAWKPEISSASISAFLERLRPRRTPWDG